MNLHDGRVAFAELGAQHLLEPRRRVHQNDLVGVEDPPLHPELDVGQLGVIDELGVDASAARDGRVADLLDRLLAVAGGKDVGEQEGRPFVL